MIKTLIFRSIYEENTDDTLALSFSKGKIFEFTPFGTERDHIGKIISVLFLYKRPKCFYV